jgi:hypothetical protein
MKPSFNPEPEATAVLPGDCRPETAGASGFGLNKEAVGRLRLTKHGRLRQEVAISDEDAQCRTEALARDHEERLTWS